MTEGNAELRVVGERQYYLKGAEAREPELVVRLGRPSQTDSGYYRCEYQFAGRAGITTSYTEGIDGIDAMISALDMMGIKLSGLNEALYGGRLQWEGGDGHGLVMRSSA